MFCSAQTAGCGVNCPQTTATGCLKCCGMHWVRQGLEGGPDCPSSVFYPYLRDEPWRCAFAGIPYEYGVHDLYCDGGGGVGVDQEQAGGSAEVGGDVLP